MNNFKRFLLTALIITLCIPLPTKGFFRAFHYLSNSKDIVWLKKTTSFQHLPPISFTNQVTNTVYSFSIADLPLDFTNYEQRLAYDKNVNLATLIYHRLNPTVINVNSPQKLSFFSLAKIPDLPYFSEEFLVNSLTSYFENPYKNNLFQLQNLKPQPNLTYSEDSILTFYFQGRSHQVPYKLLKPYVFINQAGYQTLNFKGFKKLHDILNLPYAKKDLITISNSPTQLQHTFKGQVIDHKDLTRQLNTGTSLINLKFIRPLINVTSEDSRFEFQTATIKTQYYGSPKTRVHNIHTGAKKLHSFILKPGEIFSMNSMLGEVSAKTGYQKGLVITSKGVLPEYGGGLCQVSTSIYRSALVNGLEIIEQHPHSHAVSYYAQELGHGLDAAIYLGIKDLQFKNPHDYPILFELHPTDYELIVNTYGSTINHFKFSNFKRYEPVFNQNTRYLYDPQAQQAQVVMEPVSGFKTSWDLQVNGDKQTIYSQYFAKPLTIKTAVIP